MIIICMLRLERDTCVCILQLKPKIACEIGIYSYNLCSFYEFHKSQCIIYYFNSHKNIMNKKLVIESLNHGRG